MNQEKLPQLQTQHQCIRIRLQWESDKIAKAIDADKAFKEQIENAEELSDAELIALCNKLVEYVKSNSVTVSSKNLSTALKLFLVIIDEIRQLKNKKAEKSTVTA